MKRLDIDLGNCRRFTNDDHAYFDLTLPLEQIIGIVLIKASLVDSLDEMFSQRKNYTLYAGETDLRVIEESDPNGLLTAFNKEGAVIKLMRYEGEEKKEEIRTQTSDSQTGADAFYELQDQQSRKFGV